MHAGPSNPWSLPGDVGDGSRTTCIAQKGPENRSQRAPNPPELAQPSLSQSNGGHRQREGTNVGVFVPRGLVLARCEATNLGVFDLCHFTLLKRGCENSGGFGAR